MKKVIFICHGNICRSPMAEFIFKDLVKKAGLENEFEIISRATSSEEIGNPIHRGTKFILEQAGIPFSERRAKRITKEECDEYDYLVCMDKNNIRNMAPFIGNNQKKLSLLMQYANSEKDVSDPWWTGNFDEPYEDILCGCKAFLKYLMKK